MVFWLDALSAPGVVGKKLGPDDVNWSRLNSFVSGTNMPAPGFDVVKYDMLRERDCELSKHRGAK